MSRPTFDELAGRLSAFARDRDWEQFHSPKNLAMAVAAEAGELLEHFQWLTDAESRELPTPSATGPPSKWPMCCFISCGLRTSSASIS